MTTNSAEIEGRLKKAFPAGISHDVERVVGHLRNGKDSNLDLSPDSFSVKVDNESLMIPDRVYFEEVKPVVQLTFTSVQKEILHCLYTRHHDGHVREKALKNIIRSKKVWVAPYVIRLIGEYVIEILQIIFENLDSIDSEIYKVFIKNNPEFYEVNKQRVISYWNCYFRSQYPNRPKSPNKNDHVGFKILKFFDGLVAA